VTTPLPYRLDKVDVDTAYRVQICPCCRTCSWADKRVLRSAHEVWACDVLHFGWFAELSAIKLVSAVVVDANKKPRLQNWRG
jgi:hypothetical protein